MRYQQLSQRDLKWGHIILGYGTSTIHDVGCTITCLAMMAGITPDVLNEMLKGTSYEDSAFAGSTRNLINWTKLEKYTNGLIKFHWRGYGYDGSKIKNAIAKNGACLIEVDFDGTGPRGDKHWILALGDQRANDPWSGNEVPTSKYPKWTGWAEIEINKKEDMSIELNACMQDRAKFMGEVGELHRALGVQNQTEALKEIERLQTKETDFDAHKCPVVEETKPITPEVSPEDNMRLVEKIITTEKDGIVTTLKYAVIN